MHSHALSLTSPPPQNTHLVIISSVKQRLLKWRECKNLTKSHIYQVEQGR